MKRLPALLLLTLLMLGCAKTADEKHGPKAEVGAKPEGWKRFPAPNADFTVYFPSEPEMKKIKDEENRDIDQATVARSSKDELGYSCYWFLRDKPSSAAAAQQAILDQQGGFEEEAKGKAVSEQAITVNGHPGRDFLIRLDEQIVLRCRIVLAGKLNCTLVVQGADESHVKTFDADQFFKSLNVPKAE